jgi:crotonobetainyl-CoA:carnitine CoA-transferase CaiB-like acyl-CoA transferase
VSEERKKGEPQTGRDGARPAEDETRTGALDGLIVADFSRVLSGPLSTMMLGDMGAEVIKVERPGIGDESREWGPPFVGTNVSAYYAAVNRNKSSVVLDLKDSDDRDRALALAHEADIVVENFRPGTMERLGLGYETIAERNPGVVYCAISAFGRGAGAAMPGYDFLLQATGGLMSITGDPEGPPTKVGVALVDVVTGLYATVGILGALQERTRSGRGQRIDVSLLSALLAALVNQASTFLMTGKVPERMGNSHPSVAPYELFETADDPVVLAVGNDRHFAALVRTLGASELADDPRFVDNRSRVLNIESLRREIGKRLTRAGREHWTELLTAAGVACGPVNDIGQAFELADRLGLEPVVTITAPNGEPLHQVANPLRFSRSPVSYQTAPPALGAHSDLFGDGPQSATKEDSDDLRLPGR